MTDFDRNDPKVFRESLGTIGTTTKPGENQLTQLQAKVRQGVKHVELHLMGTGKGQWHQQDVPDKYGFEQRKTIMQLAKLNKQTLSVHATPDGATSFSGLSQGGFDEGARSKVIKEIDESVKFASETAKGGAVVFHLHETQLPTPKGEINLSKSYLEDLKNGVYGESGKKDYIQLNNQITNHDTFDRRFVENIDQLSNLRVKYNNLSNKEKNNFEEKYNTDIEKYEKKGFSGVEAKVRAYARRDEIEKIKNTDQSLVIVGNSMDKVDRNKKMIKINEKGELVGKNKMTNEELNYLKEKNIDLNNFDFDEIQRFKATLLNDFEEDSKNKKVLNNLKKNYLIDYETLLEKKKWYEIFSR